MKLRKPVTFSDKTHKEITPDFSGLKGRDVISCVREAELLKGRGIGVRAVDIDFQRVVAAKAAGVPVDLLDELDARDFDDLCDEARDFFLDVD